MREIRRVVLSFYPTELWLEKNGVEDSLPGLPFTNRQMFWIHRGRSWCLKRRPDSLRNLILTGYHSPVQFRTNGPLASYEDFARDFK